MMLNFCRDKHLEYLLALDKSKDLESIGMFLRNHLKVAGGYWCLTSLEVLKVTAAQPDAAAQREKRRADRLVR